MSDHVHKPVTRTDAPHPTQPLIIAKDAAVAAVVILVGWAVAVAGWIGFGAICFIGLIFLALWGLLS